MDWLGLVLPRFNLRRPRPESLYPPRPEDLEQLAELRELGSRLDLPHPVRMFLVFYTEGHARTAHEKLQKDGFSCQIRAWPDGSWLLTSITQLVPTAGSITTLREQMEALGSTLDGSYHGWDAPVVY